MVSCCSNWHTATRTSYSVSAIRLSIVWLSTVRSTPAGWWCMGGGGSVHHSPPLPLLPPLLLLRRYWTMYTRNRSSVPDTNAAASAVSKSKLMLLLVTSRTYGCVCSNPITFSSKYRHVRHANSFQHKKIIFLHFICSQVWTCMRTCLENNDPCMHEAGRPHCMRYTRGTFCKKIYITLSSFTFSRTNIRTTEADITEGLHGRSQIFSRGGQNHQHFKKLTSFRRAVQKIDHCRRAAGANANIWDFFATFASEKFRVFCRTVAYDVIFFKFQGWGKCPPCPPPPAGAHERLGLLDGDTLTIRYRIGVVIDKSHDDYFTQRH